LGGNTTVVETNYFGKGNTTTYNRATYETVNDPQDEWHTYTIEWTAAAIEWSVDGDVVRTLKYADALDGANYPQTPMRIKLGIWDGGAADEAEGTVSWAGGYVHKFSYNRPPFRSPSNSPQIH
jgi:beta-glucanase (GH16 family)